MNFAVIQSVALTSHFVKHEHINLLFALVFCSFLMKAKKFMNITDHERNEPCYQDLNHILLINARAIGRSFIASLPEIYVF